MCAISLWGYYLGEVMSSASVKPMAKRRRAKEGDAAYWKKVADLLERAREQDRRIDETLRRTDEFLLKLRARYPR